MSVKTFNIEQDIKTSRAMHPKKFVVWLFIVSIVMIFAALTSAYLVRQGEGEWLDFKLPASFWTSTVIILLSSASMHWAYLAAKKDNLQVFKLAMIITTVLGLSFLAGQFAAWGDLVELGVYLVGNPSGSFLYVLTGLHGFHIISGIVFLLIVLGLSFRYKIHSRNLSPIEMCMTYWHFLGGLWIYLFFFLLINH